MKKHSIKTNDVISGGFFCKGWCEEWVVLYEDSTLAWYADKGLDRPRGYIRISEAPELLAVGEWTRQVPRRPRFPRTCHIGQLLAVGSRALHEVHWLMGQSPAEIRYIPKLCIPIRYNYNLIEIPSIFDVVLLLVGFNITNIHINSPLPVYLQRTKFIQCQILM